MDCLALASTATPCAGTDEKRQMKHDLRSSEPRQRRRKMGCLIVLVLVLPTIAAGFYWRVRSVEREAAALCAEARIGSPFDSSLFSEKANAAGFNTHVREGSPDSMLMCWKRAVHRSRICRIYHRDGVVTGTELMWSPN